MSLAAFVQQFRTAVTDAVLRTYPPLYNAEVRRTCGFDLGRLLRRPLGGQADAIRAIALSLQRHRGTLVVGEMGVGKSFVAAAAAYLAGCRHVVIVCPPHLVRKWRREIQRTVPDAQVSIVRTITELDRAIAATRLPTALLGAGTLPLGDAGRGKPTAVGKRAPGTMQVVICSREQAKLGYRWRPAAVLRPARDGTGHIARDDTGQVARLLCCPRCFQPALDEEDVPLALGDLERKKGRCRVCSGPLWQADRTGPRRYPLADYIGRRHRGHFDLLIIDEVHEAKARGSAQGLAAATLAGACARTLALTGTVYGGYASTLFYVLWRFSAAIRQEFGYRDEFRWVSRYGVLERITKRDTDDHADDGRQSKRKGYRTRTIERPGVAPAVLFHLIGTTAFLRLADVATDLPPYQERVLLVPLDDTVRSGTAVAAVATVAADSAFLAGPGDATPLSQARCYQRLASELRSAVTGALRTGSKRLLGTYLQALLTYPDACIRAETVVDPRSGEVIAHAPGLPDDVRYPKEQALVHLVQRERRRGWRVLVYVTHTEKRDLTPRLRAILEQEGVRVAVLKADTVRADRREEWLSERVHEGAEVLLVHPRLVQTGLDLIDWPSVVWLEPEYSIYTMRQASRRSWRIGQRLPVEVTFLAYEGTLQAQALALVAAKMRSALMLDGELPHEGLAALGTDEQDVFLALARQLTTDAGALGAGTGVGDVRSLEELFAQARASAGEDDALLVDQDWTTETETAAGEGVAPSDAPCCAPDEARAVWSQGCAALPTAEGGTQASSSATVSPNSAGRLVSFEQLAQLVHRPKARRRGTGTRAPGQLALFHLIPDSGDTTGAA